jgi:hypothetical protein
MNTPDGIAAEAPSYKTGRALRLVALAVLVGAAVPTFLGLVRAWGRNIPQTAIEADWAFGLVWALLLGASILFWPVPAREKPLLFGLWVIRIGVTLGFMLLYEWNYPLDSQYYFWAAEHEPVSSYRVGMGRGTDNLKLLTWLHYQVLPHYHAIKVSFAMVGFIAVYMVYRAAVRALGTERPMLLVVLALYPSILFWASTLGKEPLHLLGIAMYVHGVVGWYTTRRSAFLFSAALGVAIAALIRVWAGPILLLPLFVFVFRGIQGFGRRLVFLTLTLAGLALVGDAFVERFGLTSIEDVLARAELLTWGWEGGSAQEAVFEFTGIGSMLAFVPRGAFTALFRPLPGEVMNAFGLLAGIENLFLLGLLGLSLMRARVRRLGEPLVQWAILLVLTWGALYGFISYHNLGAAVRFKLQILPILVCLLLYLSRRHPEPLMKASG